MTHSDIQGIYGDGVNEKDLTELEIRDVRRFWREMGDGGILQLGSRRRGWRYTATGVAQKKNNMPPNLIKCRKKSQNLRDEGWRRAKPGSRKTVLHDAILRRAKLFCATHVSVGRAKLFCATYVSVGRAKLEKKAVTRPRLAPKLCATKTCVAQSHFARHRGSCVAQSIFARRRDPSRKVVLRNVCLRDVWCLGSRKPCLRDENWSVAQTGFSTSVNAVYQMCF